MTISIKGFVEIQNLISNVPNVTSAIGELSTQSRTYSLDKGEYSLSQFPGYSLTTFYSVDSVNGPVQTSTVMVQEILSVAAAIYGYATSHLRPYDSTDFLNTLTTDFVGKLGNINIGDFVDNGTVALPQWISWDSYENGVSQDYGGSATGTSCMIWFSDAAFQSQYDEYSIVPVVPVDTLDDFFKTPATVVNELSALTYSQIISRIKTAKGTNPESAIEVYEFDYINPQTGQVGAQTLWGVLVYGMAGDNIDAVKAALINYILANSTHSRDEWTAILPSLFKTTEFLILPRWDKYAIPNLSIKAGLYSCLEDPMESVTFAQTQATFYSPAWVQSNITIVPFPYKYLSLVVVNGPNNVAGAQKLTDLYSDYIFESSTSPDFARLSMNTQTWITQLQSLLIAAEKATKYSTLDPAFRKIYRNGKLYISMVYNNVDYLAAAYQNYGA